MCDTAYKYIVLRLSSTNNTVSAYFQKIIVVIVVANISILHDRPQSSHCFQSVSQTVRAMNRIFFNEVRRETPKNATW